jgi:hypothetical protein
VFLDKVESPTAQEMQAVWVQSGVLSPRRFEKMGCGAPALKAEVCVLTEIKASSRDAHTAVLGQSQCAVVAIYELLVEWGRLTDKICGWFVVLYLAHQFPFLSVGNN